MIMKIEYDFSAGQWAVIGLVCAVMLVWSGIAIGGALHDAFHVH